MLCRIIHIYTPTHIITDNNEPAGDAKPMGKSVVGYNADMKYERGIRAHTIEMKLWQKEMIE